MEPGTPESGLNRIALEIQYDGTCYNGWQIQNSGKTVQGEIERAIKILTRRHVRLICAGRTDTGVHALGQVAHFNPEEKISLQRLCIGLNGILERDISIKNAYNVLPDFHARFSAVCREYIYLIYNHHLRNPFMTNRALWISHPLDLDYLRETAGYLVGEMDFKSFCKKISANENTVRRIDSIEIKKYNEVIVIRIKGNAFLHNMIRIIVGTMYQMFKDKKDPDYIVEIIKSKDREMSGDTAPPCGLYLNCISYQPPLSSMESAF